MTPPNVEVEVSSPRDLHILEESFRVIWEKVRAASEIIQNLRSENLTLKTDVERIQNEVSTLRSDLLNREQDLKRIRLEHSQLIASNGKKQGFTDEEREQLKNTIRDLIAKINSHL